MADTTLQADSAHANLAAELRALERRASEYEVAVRQATAGLNAIANAGLFDNLPPDPADRKGHSNGMYLLDMIEGELTRVDETGKPALSDKLGILARRFEREGGDHG